MSNAVFNKIFKDANETKCRYRVMRGGAGSGKSVNLCMDYILKLSDPKYAGCSLLVVRKTESSHLNSTFAELTAAIDRMGLNSMWESKLNPLTLRNKITGNSIIFRGCNDQRAIERMKSVTVQSGKVTHIFCEEATELLQSDVEILDDRLRGKIDNPNGYFQLTFAFNPISSSHWLKRAFWDYDSPDIFRHTSTYLDNKFIDAEYKARMERRKEIDYSGWLVYSCAEWGEEGGLVFPNATIGDYRHKEFEMYSIGVDWGFNHATAVLKIGWSDGEPYVLNEVYATGKTTGEIIELCNKAKMPKDILAFCDSASPDQIKELKLAGYKAYPVSKEKNSVSNQIAWLKNRHIYIDGSCQNTLKEIQSYKYRKDPTTGEYLDEPIKFNDDCMAALRYGCEPVRKQTKVKSMKKGDLSLW